MNKNLDFDYVSEDSTVLIKTDENKITKFYTAKNTAILLKKLDVLSIIYNKYLINKNESRSNFEYFTLSFIITSIMFGSLSFYDITSSTSEILKMLYTLISSSSIVSSFMFIKKYILNKKEEYNNYLLYLRELDSIKDSNYLILKK
ncbi:MAG: hypothetical protein RSB41_01190 [Bacilli bacterium]